MSVETVKLATIINTVMPEVHHVLRTEELNAFIVLRNGIQNLDKHDVLEIVEATINNAKRSAIYH
ncbi:hypothetical protein PP175_06590 [Aneurinibacillus sp. Ricciae_BoGa-3]|nr:hypothetical protein [Aneurinibacillus sp. Ricciae_BoGa-3]WCK56748.1 hypothetical protein PP175_06590 [Aneurinibacillus sp. Ricciae_BoGa-3]